MQNNKSNNISGRNIYLDRHGQTVFYDFITRMGYIIDKKNKSKFYVYKNRYILLLMAIILLSEYFPSWETATIIGISFCILAETLFRFRFLRNLRTTNKFNRKVRQTMLKSIIESNEPKRAILRVILYIAFAILIVLNAYLMQVDIAIWIISIFLGIMATYCSIINVIALVKMK